MDGNLRLKEMINNNNLKYNNIPKEAKEIKKFNIKEKMNQMKNGDKANKAREDIPKIIPKKKFDDNYLKTFDVSKKEKEKEIKKQIPNKINGDEIVNKMNEEKNSKTYDINAEFDFCVLDIKGRDINKFFGTINFINDKEEQRKHFEKVQKIYTILQRKRREEMKKNEIERKLQEEERKKAKEELIKKREKEEDERKKKLEERRIKKEKEKAERKEKADELKKGIIEAKKRLEKELKRIEEEKIKKEKEWEMKEEKLKRERENYKKKREEEEKVKLEEEEAEKKKMEEEWKIKEENWKRERENNRKKREEEERVKLDEEEAEKNKIEEEKRIQYEKWKRDAEEKRKRREEEEKKRLKEEEAERKKREEEERIRKQKEEEKRRKKEAELKLLQEKYKREEEERRKKEEEEEKERRRLEEEEEKERQRLEKEKEERTILEERESERKRKERGEILKAEALKKMNKKEEDLTQEELRRLLEKIYIKVRIEEYESITYKKFNYNHEGKSIKHSFEKIKQISTDKVKNLEVTNTGKIVALTKKGFSDDKDCSTITIYKEATYEIEKSETLKCKVNSFKIYGNKIYCSLSKENDNILIISLDNFEDKTYLNGHSYAVTDLTLTSYGYLLSSDIKGNIKAWKDNKIKKSINDFHKQINTISEINEPQQRIAILSFNEEKLNCMI